MLHQNKPVKNSKKQRLPSSPGFNVDGFVGGKRRAAGGHAAGFGEQLEGQEVGVSG